MIFMEIILFVALTSGSLLSSFVYAATSSAFVQSLSCLIVIIATLFIIFYLPESLGMSPEEDEVPEKEKNVVVTVLDHKNKTNEISAEAEKTENCDDPPKYESPEKPLEDKVEKAGLFSIKHVKDMFSTCFKKRENNAHTIIWLVTLAGFVSIFVAGKSG